MAADDIQDVLSSDLRVLKLNWNKLHIQSRQEICLGACVSEKMACKSWEELDRWLQSLLEYSTESRSKGRIQLCG